MTHLEFLRDKFGGDNWVVARRSPRIVRRYGENVICISRAKYAAADKAWREALWTEKESTWPTTQKT